jgi:hypothetical protein
MATPNPEKSGIAKIERNRADLEDLAESDLPAAELAKSFLEVTAE